ncbi:Caspase domain-containing protein [Streptomyces sp. cf386]|nr:Caspase domain-containing protein [Streptomyces sp. cf386]
MTDFPLGTGRRDALLIATGTYDDTTLGTLRSPEQDCAGLAAVLADPSIGGFRTEQVKDAQAHQVMRAIERFFLDRSRHDLLLVHVSCHGIKDLHDGHLYFAARDTDRTLPASTAVPAAFLRDRMERCRATVVVLLDCCYSGAFLPGAKGDDQIHVREELGGHGRAVLTATNRAEYAWEGEHVASQEPQPSRFTGALIEGLRTGTADLNRDGRITVTELYDYVYESLHRAGTKQRPLMWAELEYQVTIARAVGAQRRAAATESTGMAPPPPQNSPVPPRPQTPPLQRTLPQEGPDPRHGPAAGPGTANQTPMTAAEAVMRAKLDATSRTRRGQDALIRLELDLEETALGAVREFEVDTAVVCPTCGGSGEATRGWRLHCRECRGDGRVRSRRTLSVRIPAGVKNGMRIQLAGEGEVGPGGGPAGDLYVEVVELPHQVFQRMDDDLHCTVTVPTATAKSGGTAPLPTLDGQRTIRIPPGTPDGRTLRLAQLGATHLRVGGRGDVLVHIKVSD